MKKRILTIGNPVYDVIYTPKITRKDRVLSGCSTNACLAISYLDEQGILVGSIGLDYQQQIIRELEQRAIEYHLLPSNQTGGFSLIYDEHGDRELTLLGVADPIPKFTNTFEPLDFILIGPILGEVNSSVVYELKRSSQSPVLLDPQGTLRFSKNGHIDHKFTKSFQEIASISTIIKANELETRVITGIEARKNPEDAVKALYQTGCQIAVVTLAEAGSIIYDGNVFYPIPPYKTQAIDPTGAGDTYAAGFMVKYLETPNDLSAVGCFASGVASVMVENSGPDFPLSRNEADRRFAYLTSQPLKLAL